MDALSFSTHWVRRRCGFVDRRALCQTCSPSVLGGNRIEEMEGFKEMKAENKPSKRPPLQHRHLNPRKPQSPSIKRLCLIQRPLRNRQIDVCNAGNHFENCVSLFLLSLSLKILDAWRLGKWGMVMLETDDILINITPIAGKIRKADTSSSRW